MIANSVSRSERARSCGKSVRFPGPSRIVPNENASSKSSSALRHKQARCLTLIAPASLAAR
jgi:hypothetical protein